MAWKTILVALMTGSLAILLGLWQGLDRLVEQLRNDTSMGMPQPVFPDRPRTTVTRQERLCFIAFGAAVILVSLVYAVMAR
jgi:hypothetical protein